MRCLGGCDARPPLRGASPATKAEHGKRRTQESQRERERE